MKKILTVVVIVALIIIGLLLAPGLVSAGGGATVVLPDGTSVPLSGLSPMEKQTMMKYLDKVAANQTKGIVDKQADDILNTVANSMSDPDKINSWRQLITGTIKDICNDLNVTVNDFVKTPVGLGVAALIFYKVAGKDLLTKITDVVLIIPFWIIVTIIVSMLRWVYLSPVLVYDKVIEETDDKGKKKVTKLQPRRKLRYPWNTDGARMVFCWLLGIFWIVATTVSTVIVFN